MTELIITDLEAEVLKASTLAVVVADNRSSLDIPQSVYEQADHLKRQAERGHREFKLTSEQVNTVQLMCEAMRVIGGYVSGFNVPDEQMEAVVSIESKVGGAV